MAVIGGIPSQDGKRLYHAIRRQSESEWIKSTTRVPTWFSSNSHESRRRA
jgi:hypothetical protein